MPNNWGYVFGAYGAAAILIVGYWRYLAQRARAARAATRRGRR